MISKTSFPFYFSLLNVDHVKLSSRWNFNNVVSPYYRIYYIDDGQGYIEGVEKKVLLEPGYLYIIPSFTLCNLKCDSYLNQYFIQFFEESSNGISLFHNNREIQKVRATEMDIAAFKKIVQINPGRGINRSDNPKVYEKQSFYQEYQALNENMSLSQKFLNQGILLQLISNFVNTPSHVKSNAEIPSKILDAMNYIELHIHQNIVVSELAERANQSQDYFSRLFLHHVGQRPLTYIHEKKIERAQYLITTTDKTFLEISLETGFSSLAHFSHIFKKVLGTTPGKYRQQVSKMA